MGPRGRDVPAVPQGLIVTAVLVMAGAAAAVVPPLMVRRIFDDALFPPAGASDMRLLVELVSHHGGALCGDRRRSACGRRTSRSSGHAVTGDLRMRLFAQLQSMELAFFTRTKTGVIQSRLQNDVGGVSGVLTTFFSTIVGNTVTVIAITRRDDRAGLAPDLLAVVLMPALVVVQRRVGQVRARIATKTQESLSEMTSITQETLSVSGILLSKVYNRQRFETARYGAENRTQIRLQVQQAMTGQWFFGVVTVIMSSVPAVIYLVAGVLITRGERRRNAHHRGNRRGVHGRAGAPAVPPHGAHAGGARRADVAGAVRSHLRIPGP